eukprot:s271_g14.t1
MTPGVAPRNLAFVEVRQRAGAGTWYEAILRDLQLDKVWVAFDRGIWPSREIPCQHVRARVFPVDSPPQLIAGAEVEVRFPATEDGPAHWSAGSISHNACEQDNARFQWEGRIFVVVEGRELAVALDAVRAPSQQVPLNPLAFTRAAELHGWLSLPDARGCLEQVRSTTGLHLATPGVEHPHGGNGVVVQDLDAVILIGGEAAIARASMVLKIHLMHQAEVEAFHRRRAKKLAQLKELEAKGLGEDARLSFEVDADLIGRTCGKGGERVKKVEKEPVQTWSCDSSAQSENSDLLCPRSSTIYCDSDADAEGARRELELRKQLYALPAERITWFQRNDNRLIQDVTRKAGLAAATWAESGLELCGQQSSLEDAVLLLDSHNEYFLVYRDSSRNRVQQQKQGSLMPPRLAREDRDDAFLPSRGLPDEPLSPQLAAPGDGPRAVHDLTVLRGTGAGKPSIELPIRRRPKRRAHAAAVAAVVVPGCVPSAPRTSAAQHKGPDRRMRQFAGMNNRLRPDSLHFFDRSACTSAVASFQLLEFRVIRQRLHFSTMAFRRPLLCTLALVATVSMLPATFMAPSPALRGTATEGRDASSHGPCRGLARAAPQRRHAPCGTEPHLLVLGAPLDLHPVRALFQLLLQLRWLTAT